MSSTKDFSSSISTLSHKRNFWYIVGSVLIVLILAGGYLYYQSAQQKSKAQRPAVHRFKPQPSVREVSSSAPAAPEQWSRRLQPIWHFQTVVHQAAPTLRYTRSM